MSRIASLSPARGPRQGFRQDIQGLRALAVTAVVLYHAGVPALSGGYVGVDMFFVISGFLITTHLYQALLRDGRISLSSFYAKRARRILPASFVVLALSVVAAALWLPPLAMDELGRGAVATSLYVPNVLFALNGTDYLAESSPSVFQHYWSLGIEEQFYLLWPAFMALIWALRPSKTLLALGLLLATVVSFSACLIVAPIQQPLAFFLLPTRAWELGVGGLLAVITASRTLILRRMVVLAAGWIGVAVLVGSVFLFKESTPFPGVWSLIPVLGTAFLIFAGSSSDKAMPERFFAFRPIQWIGKISYSIYLVHWPLLVIPQAHAGFQNKLPLAATLALGAASIPLGWLLHRYVEEPARQTVWLASYRPRRTAALAAAASLTTVAIALGLSFWSEQKPLQTDEAAQGLITSPPKATPFVPANLEPPLRTASESQPSIYSDGCHLNFNATEPADCVFGDPSLPRIVLFGDSHAAQWFPAVSAWAEKSGYALQMETKSSCPSVDVSVLRNDRVYTACDEWRKNVIAALNIDKPKLVLLANYGKVQLADASLSDASAWSKGLRRTIASLQTPVSIVADTPDLGFTPAICLSANVQDTSACQVSRVAALDEPARRAEVETAESERVPYLDFTDYICSKNECNPIIGNLLVYRDAHHLTVDFSAALSPIVGQRLEAALANQ